MLTSTQIAKLLRAVYFGGNWCAVNLKDTLADVSWQQATTKVYSLNTIATLVYHMNYYVMAISKVLEGGPLDAHDKYSFDHPQVLSQDDWEKLLDKTWKDAENFARLVEQLPESKLWEIFSDAKYGNYYRNIHGVIEHNHYHLGQIVLIRKVLLNADEK
ncbi:MAG TPA: hypothetical protein VK483_16850 [Chitinophagaceae bacterium]|nr:hypothetical protein [Chitinophagaceae bacterium]